MNKSIAVVSCGLALGCGASVREVAKEAAPAAVESSVKEVHTPSTRERVAEVLADAQIRRASAELAQSLTDGALTSLTDERGVQRLTAATDAYVANMSAVLAESLRKDLGPAVADIGIQTVERSLGQFSEERFRKLSAAMTSAALDGAREGLLDASGKLQPAAADALGQVAREVAHQAALGFQDAVAETTQRRERGKRRPGQILAAAGEASETILGGLSVTAWVLVAVVALLLGALVWVGWRLRRELILNRQLTLRALAGETAAAAPRPH